MRDVDNYPKIEPGDLPPNLESITFGNSFEQCFDGIFVFKISFPTSSLLFSPFVCFVFVFVANIISDTISGKSFLPDSVRTIVFPKVSRFTSLLSGLPPHLSHLSLPERYNQIITSLPPSLTSLFLGESFNEPLDSVLRDLPKLTHLVFGNEYTHATYLPPSLQRLVIGSGFPIWETNLPPGLLRLTFGSRFNR